MGVHKILDMSIKVSSIIIHDKDANKLKRAKVVASLHFVTSKLLVNVSVTCALLESNLQNYFNSYK